MPDTPLSYAVSDQQCIFPDERHFRAAELHFLIALFLAYFCDSEKRQMKSAINIQVELAEDKMPLSIEWTAPDGGVPDWQKSKAMLLGLWDGDEKSAMRIDLWTGKMMVDEMNDFFYQTIFGMADTYLRATRNEELSKDMKEFAKSFLKKASDALEKEGK
jgi:gliding motility-associated protein GldC